MEDADVIALYLTTLLVAVALAAYEAYLAGRHRGRRDGYAAGYAQACEDYGQQVTAALDREIERAHRVRQSYLAARN